MFFVVVFTHVSDPYARDATREPFEMLQVHDVPGNLEQYDYPAGHSVFPNQAYQCMIAHGSEIELEASSATTQVGQRLPANEASRTPHINGIYRNAVEDPIGAADADFSTAPDHANPRLLSGGSSEEHMDSEEDLSISSMPERFQHESRPLSNVNVVDDLKIAFLMRHFSESIGPWYLCTILRRESRLISIGWTSTTQGAIFRITFLWRPSQYLYCGMQYVHVPQNS